MPRIEDPHFFSFMISICLTSANEHVELVPIFLPRTAIQPAGWRLQMPHFPLAHPVFPQSGPCQTHGPVGCVKGTDLGQGAGSGKPTLREHLT